MLCLPHSDRLYELEQIPHNTPPPPVAFVRVIITAAEMKLEQNAEDIEIYI